MWWSLTCVSACGALFIGGKCEEKENRVMQWTKRRYAPALAWSLRRRRWVLGGALALVVVSGLVAMRLGSEFIPSLDEGDIAMHAMRIPGTGIEQAVKMQIAVEERVMQSPRSEEHTSELQSLM